ncbi:dimethyladenosine transferase [Plasmopara halstedii]|uniref:rRNA adenine N(6)-methyltransferase n=1 Tax=Plasmopara halstedii TaxID=4781 RepID=A0A0P1B2G7_PLAHL|nr:dimethyladenosine transferase [Plasmopara halstedii]CEG47599.1 dimethyladenosine transferase [Plasmopara halstedii]|eukprot:XP_024583968.1 dimethyladenosine transferase [Plasmopara halstedii]
MSFVLSKRGTRSASYLRLKGPLYLRRKLGQHLLISDGILNQIISASELPITSSELVRVLEIGPGTGNLTSALLKVGSHITVHAVEYDSRMVRQLKLRFPTEIEAANIPYQLSSLVISRLSRYMHRFATTFKCAVLLVQEEFALRLLAQPGHQNFSRLSANTALVADITSIVEVPRHHFLPPPNVDSRVIKLVPRVASTPALPSDDPLFFQKFDALLRLCFVRKNKTLRALLLEKTARSQYVFNNEALVNQKDEHQVITERVEAALDASGLISKRAVKVSVAEFIKLMHELNEHGVGVRPSSTRHFEI